MKRRDAVLALFALGAAPLAVFAQQQGKVWRIGFLGSTSSTDSAWRTDALREGLRDFGYVEGKNLVIEYRWAEGKYERLPELAVELVRLNVDIIVTHGTPASRALKAATTTIPIVMAAIIEPVANGLVTSIARPGGNLTGETFFNAELNSKRLELLRDAFPRIRRVAYLFNSDNPGSPVREMKAAAESLKLDLHLFGVRSPSEFETAFVAMRRQRIEAIAIFEEPMLLANSAAAASLAAKHRIPSIGFIEFAERGGLIAYGVNLREMHRRAAYFVDKIFKGSNPGDLPIEQATRFDLVINMKTAKGLKLKIPQSLLLRADAVIE